jgi:hypothetical protein
MLTIQAGFVHFPAFEHIEPLLGVRCHISKQFIGGKRKRLVFLKNNFYV